MRGKNSIVTTLHWHINASSIQLCQFRLISRPTGFVLCKHSVVDFYSKTPKIGCDDCCFSLIVYIWGLV